MNPAGDSIDNLRFHQFPMRHVSWFLLAAGLLALAGCASTPARVDHGPIRAATFSFVKRGPAPLPGYADDRQPIHSMIQAAISRNLAARGVNMSAGHLSREFKKAYGESPYSYLMTRRIERAMALLRRGDLSVTEVCFEVGCSSLGTFSTRFTELVGAAPMRYLTGWRMQLAKQMMREGGRNIQEIATSVGYESEAAFNRAFKRATGSPPAAWRKHAS